MHPDATTASAESVEDEAPTAARSAAGPDQGALNEGDEFEPPQAAKE